MITFECDFLDFRENDTLSHYAGSVCIKATSLYRAITERLIPIETAYQHHRAGQAGAVGVEQGRSGYQPGIALYGVSASR